LFFSMRIFIVVVVFSFYGRGSVLVIICGFFPLPLW